MFETGPVLFAEKGSNRVREGRREFKYPRAGFYCLRFKFHVI